MTEEESYHPAVDRIMETSGDDIGRIKDVDVAHKVVMSEGSLEGNIRSEIQRSAVQHGERDAHLASAS